MQGNVVTAARWLGASLVLASVILVGGFHWVLSSRAGRLAESMRVHQQAVATVRPERVEKLLAESEKLRQAGDEWEPFWLRDQASHRAPYRTSGGVGP